MNFPLFVARRYFLSKKTKNVVNIISMVAMVGVIIGTAALVVILSVFSGFEELIKSFYGVFDAEIKITAVEGKQFDPSADALQQLKQSEEIVHYCEVVEGIAHLRYEDRQYVVRNVRGVDSTYIEMIGLSELMYQGNPYLDDGNFHYTIIGQGVSYFLGISTNFIRPIYFTAPKKGKGITMFNPFNKEHLFLSGVFNVNQQDINDNYALIPKEVARELFEIDTNVTSVELALSNDVDTKKFQRKVQALLGDAYLVQNRYQQHEAYYKIAKIENFFIYLILCFVLAIASFNLAGSISMLIIDKKRDINILISLGLSRKKLGRIFLLEGILVTGIGMAIGLTLGVLVCWSQIYFGWLRIPGNLAIDTYPVDLRLSSIFIIAATVVVIGTFFSWLPVNFLSKHFFQDYND